LIHIALIDFFRKTDKTDSAFYNLADKFEAFCISVITEYEIFIGATSLEQKEFWKQFLQIITIFPLNSDIVHTALNINESLKQKRKQIESADLFIAATALKNNLPLATLNDNHFERIEGIKLVR
jgi:predicted nucleic acid-binding protein